MSLLLYLLHRHLATYVSESYIGIQVLLEVPTGLKCPNPTKLETKLHTDNEFRFYKLMLLNLLS